MPSANDLRKGMAIKYNNDVCVVLDMQHRTPGNLRAFVQATLRSLKTGKSRTSASPRPSRSSSFRRTPSRRFQLQDQAGFHFMDPETYETINAQRRIYWRRKNYLTENLRCSLTEVEGKIASSNSRPPLTSRSSKPRPVSAATPPPMSRSPPRSKPVSKSSSPSSSTPATASASTPAPVNT